MNKPKKAKAEVKPELLPEATTLSAADIKNSVQSLELKAVPVVTPEWRANSRAFIAEIDAQERDQLEIGFGEWRGEDVDERDSMVGYRAYAVAFCLCGPERDRLYPTDAEVKDMATVLLRKPAKTTTRLFGVATKLNALTYDDVESLEKKSVIAAESDGSGEQP